MAARQRRRGTLFKLLTLTLPAMIVGGLIIAAAVEAAVRLAWEPRNGLPGLFLRDPVTKQRLAVHYQGWFAGVPVRINNLGMRAERDYDLAKRQNTFRILVLGDSITFGHGSVHTYPDLLQKMLQQWRPEIDWQVWNAGVPGYNTSQELAKLLQSGPSYRPDLVVVAFYENDLVDNEPVAPPDRKTILGSRLLSFVQRNFYSYELYKKIALNIAWKYSQVDEYRRRLEHLETEAQLLASVEETSDLKAQQLTNYTRLTPAEAAAQQCVDHEKPSEAELAAMQRQPGWEDWLAAVRGFQELHKRGDYRIVFFANVIPPVCPDGDFFHVGGTGLINEFFMRILADGTPAVSTFDMFLRRRPSEMPAARGHAIGNANHAKAEVLFDYLRDSVLPAALPQSTAVRK